MTCPVDCPLYKENERLKARNIALEETQEALKKSICELLGAAKDKDCLKKKL